MAKKKKKLYFVEHPGEFIIALLMIFLCAITLLPSLHVVAKAFSSEGPVIAGLVNFVPVDFQLGTIGYVLKQVEFQNAFLVSLFTTIVGSTLGMILVILAAYPLSKPKFKGRKGFLLLFIFTMLFQAGMVPKYLLFRALNLINTLPALFIGGLFSTYNMLLIKNYMEQLPEEVEESARIDGAGDFTTLFKIVLPMCKPVLATTTLFLAVGFWNNYFSGVLYITKPELKPLQQYLLDVVNQATNLRDPSGNIKDISAAMNLSGESVQAATIVVSTVPILIVYPFLQKYFVAGLTIGSVKG